MSDSDDDLPDGFEDADDDAPADPVPLTRADPAVATADADAEIPTDPRQRILRVPIPKDVDGKPVCTRAELEPEYRKALAERHSKALDENYVERDIMLEETEDEFQGFAAAREEQMRLCAVDIAYWFRMYVWTVDPRAGKGEVPFLLYDEQVESVKFWQDVFLPAAHSQEGIVVLEEKSRAIGATWEKAGCVVHGLLFEKDFSALISMVIEDDIDDGGIDGTEDTFFGKMRYILERLPEWMVPEGMCTNKAVNKLRSIKNPKNGNFAKGRQYCGNIGRGRRYTVYLGDEFAAAEKAEAAASSFSQTSRGIMLFFTPCGMDNEAARMRHGDGRRFVRTRHWTLNPYNNVDWYWGEREKWGPTRCASELDINYHGSTPRTILVGFDPDRYVISARPRSVSEAGEILEAREDLDYDKNLPLSICMDPGFGDPFAIAWMQPHEGLREYRWIDFIQYERKEAEFLVPFLVGHIPDVTLRGEKWPYKYSELEHEIIRRHGEWGAADEACGDSDGAAGSVQTGEYSIYDLFEGYGLCPVYPVKISKKLKAIDNVRNGVYRMRFAPRCATQRTQSKHTPTLVECFEHWSWAPPPKGGTRSYTRVPKHDVYCHVMDAVQQRMLYEDVTSPDVVPIPSQAQRDFWRKHGLTRGEGGRLGEHSTGGIHETADSAYRDPELDVDHGDDDEEGWVA